jgi:hypothetical protein
MTERVDPSAIFERLKADVIEQLGFDAKALRPWQSARVHSLSLLHLEMDRMTTEALQGRAVDPKAVAVVGEQMERLLNPSFGGDSPEAHEIVNEEARAKLMKLIDGISMQQEFEADAALQAEEAAAIAAALPVSVVSEAKGANLATFAEADPDAPPPSDNTRTTYIDAATIAPNGSPPVSTEVMPAEHPLRYTSLGNPNGVPTPRTPRPVSPYDGFRPYEERMSGGIGALKSGSDWSPPEGF